MSVRLWEGFAFRQKTLALTVLLLSAFVSHSSAQSPQPFSGYFVSDFVDFNIRLFNASDQLVATYRAGGFPAAILVSPNGRLAYVANVESPYISVLDLTIAAEIRRIQNIPRTTCNSGAQCIAMSKDGTRLVVAGVSPTFVPLLSSVNTADFSQKQGFIQSAACDPNNTSNCLPVSVAVAAGKAYLNPRQQVTNFSLSLPISIINLNALQPSPVPLSTVPIAGTAAGFPSGPIVATLDESYVVAIQGNTLMLVRTADDSLVQSVAPPANVLLTALAVGAGQGAAGTIYGVGVDNNSNVIVSLYSIANGQLQAGPVSAPLNLPIFPLEAVANGARLYLANPGQSNIAVIDATSLTATLPPASQLSGVQQVGGIGAGLLQTTAPASPLITGLSPQLVINSDSDANRTVTISGSNFASDSLVRFGNADPVPGTLTSAGLQAVVPAGVSAQAANVIVTNANSGNPDITQQNQSGILRGKFTIAPPSSYQPENQVLALNGDGSLVTLNGSNDTASLPSVPGFFFGIGIGITPDAAHAYVGEFLPPDIYIYDIANGVMNPMIQLNPGLAPNGQGSIGGQEDEITVVNSPITASNGPAAFYVSNNPHPDSTFDLSLFVVDADPTSPVYNTVVQQFQAGLNLQPYLPGGVALTPDGRYAYANSQESFLDPGWNFDTRIGNLIVFDTVNRTTNVISVTSLSPTGVAGFQGHIEVSPDGKSLLLAAVGGGIGVFDIGVNPMSPTYVATINGPAPAGLLTPRFFEYRIPKNVPTQLVAFDQIQNVVGLFNFDRANNNFAFEGSVIVPGPIGVRDAFGLDVTPDGKLAYVTVSSGEDVAVVNTSSPTSPVLETKILTGEFPGTVAVRPGSPVTASSSPTSTTTVMPMNGVTVSLTGNSAGAVSATTTNTTPVPPPGTFQISGIPLYYNLASTATFSTAVVCIRYNPAQVPNPESSLRLAHYDSTIDPTINHVIGWVDATLPNSPDISAHTICGQVSSFSPFVIGIAAPDFLFSSLLFDISSLDPAMTPVGIMRSLRAKVLAARASHGWGHDGAAVYQLNSLIEELEAQSGKHISSSDANNLISEAGTLINEL